MGCGIIVAIVCLVALPVAYSFRQTTNPGSSFPALGFLVLCALAIVAFIAWEAWLIKLRDEERAQKKANQEDSGK